VLRACFEQGEIALVVHLSVGLSVVNLSVIEQENRLLFLVDVAEGVFVPERVTPTVCQRDFDTLSHVGVEIDVSFVHNLVIRWLK